MAGLISNGSFVLGDPNTRDLYLGKGLKDGFEGDKYYIAADETVLWENPNSNGQMTVGESFTLSESMRNFERVDFYINDRYANTTHVETVFIIVTDSAAFSFSAEFLHSNGVIYQRIGRIEHDTEYTVLTLSRFNELNISEGNTSTVKNANVATGTSVKLITKIVGINRKRG